MDGNLFALDREFAKRVFGCKDDPSILAVVEELMAESTVAKLTVHGYAELAKAYEQAAAERENSGLGFALLGGRPMHQGPEHVVRLVRPDIVRGLATEMGELNAAEIDGLTDESMAREHSQIAAFYSYAAADQCAVLFAASAP